MIAEEEVTLRHFKMVSLGLSLLSPVLRSSLILSVSETATSLSMAAWVLLPQSNNNRPDPFTFLLTGGYVRTPEPYPRCQGPRSSLRRGPLAIARQKKPMLSSSGLSSDM